VRLHPYGVQRNDSHPQAIPGGPDLSALHGPSEFIFGGDPIAGSVGRHSDFGGHVGRWSETIRTRRPHTIAR
jgi:hypothetical protein